MALRVINETHWHTWDLRKFILAGLRERGCESRDFTATIKYARSRTLINGEAELGSPFVTLWLPRGRLNYLDLAQTLLHEIDHTLGLDHDVMISYAEDIKTHFHYGLNIRKKKPPVFKSGSMGKRELVARTKLAEWTKKYKLAKTTYQKYKKRVSYYDAKRHEREAIEKCDQFDSEGNPLILVDP